MSKKNSTDTKKPAPRKVIEFWELQEGETNFPLLRVGQTYADKGKFTIPEWPDPIKVPANSLVVEFKATGKSTEQAVWLYKGVPDGLLESLRSATSIGSAFHKLVKQGGFKEYKLTRATGEWEAK